MSEEGEMFRAPVNRTMRILDRAFFHLNIPISAAKVSDIKNLSRIRQTLLKSQEILNVRQYHPIQSLGAEKDGVKCVLLKPAVVCDDQKTWSRGLSGLVEEKDVSLIPWTLKLDYKNWNYHEIMSSILPEDLLDDLPGAFAHAGHIAQVNLRDPYLPYKNLIGQVILDKNPSIRTVINKADTLNSDNEFRVLDFEVIAGDHDFLVETKETGAIFRFDYSKVFWNSRLSTEHQRLVDLFEPGEMVCDVMAGVGPFAVPAGKKGVFVWANDLNPYTDGCLKEAIKLNKVTDFVHSFCEDGHTFIPSSANRLLNTNHTARIPKKLSRTTLNDKSLKLSESDRYTLIPQPRTFSHYVMNLPSTAVDFVPDFIGLYDGHESLFVPNTDVKLPMVHCYCFAPKAEEDDPKGMKPREEICRELSEKLGYKVEMGDEEMEIKIWDVRDVAPKKRQYCASFRVPREVAFRKRV